MKTTLKSTFFHLNWNLSPEAYIKPFLNYCSHASSLGLIFSEAKIRPKPSKPEPELVPPQVWAFQVFPRLDEELIKHDLDLIFSNKRTMGLNTKKSDCLINYLLGRFIELLLLPLLLPLLPLLPLLLLPLPQNGAD